MIKDYFIDKSFLSLTESQVFGSSDPGPGVPGPRSRRPEIPGPRVPGSQGPGSRVLCPHFRLCRFLHWRFFKKTNDKD